MCGTNSKQSAGGDGGGAGMGGMRRKLGKVGRPAEKFLCQQEY